MFACPGAVLARPGSEFAGSVAVLAACDVLPYRDSQLGDATGQLGDVTANSVTPRANSVTPWANSVNRVCAGTG